MVSTPPAPSGPHRALPQPQAAQGGNEVIFLRRVHLEDSLAGEQLIELGRPAQGRGGGGKVGPGGRRGTWSVCRELLPRGVIHVGAAGSRAAASTLAGCSRRVGKKRCGGQAGPPSRQAHLASCGSVGGESSSCALLVPGGAPFPRQGPGVTRAPNPEMRQPGTPDRVFPAGSKDLGEGPDVPRPLLRSHGDEEPGWGPRGPGFTPGGHGDIPGHRASWLSVSPLEK